MNTIDKLNRLAEMKSQADMMRLHYEDLRRNAIPPEVQGALDDIDAEEATATEALNEGMAGLETEIKDEVTGSGETVKGDYLMAVFNRPRVTWDTKRLDGYAKAHPEIEAFKKVGTPSVTIRKI